MVAGFLPQFSRNLAPTFDLMEGGEQGAPPIITNFAFCRGSDDDDGNNSNATVHLALQKCAAREILLSTVGGCTIGNF